MDHKVRNLTVFWNKEREKVERNRRKTLTSASAVHNHLLVLWNYQLYEKSTVNVTDLPRSPPHSVGYNYEL